MIDEITKSERLMTMRLPSGRRKLLQTICRKVKVDDDPMRELCVPAGFVTDYSSIPWFARFLVRWSKVDIAGVFHDYLYRERKYPRAFADAVWRVLAMQGAHSANPVQAWACWAALRLFARYKNRD